MSNVSPAAMWGAMLKYYREQAGLSQTKLADPAKYSAAQIASVEIGRRNPSEGFARRCDEATGAQGALIRLFDLYIGQMGFTPAFREWPEIEREATMLRGYESVLVPGLIQAPEYAAIILRLDGEEAIAARLARQELFNKEDPPVVRFVIDEWILRRPVGDADVMFRQLQYIEDAVTSGRVHVQVLPSGALPEMYGAFVLATVEERTVAYVESTAHGAVLHGREDIHRLEAWFDRLLAESLNSRDSLELIRQVKDETWKS